MDPVHDIPASYAMTPAEDSKQQYYSYHSQTCKAEDAISVEYVFFYVKQVHREAKTDDREQYHEEIQMPGPESRVDLAKIITLQYDDSPYYEKKITGSTYYRVRYAKEFRVD